MNTHTLPSSAPQPPTSGTTNNLLGVDAALEQQQFELESRRCLADSMVQQIDAVEATNGARQNAKLALARGLLSEASKRSLLMLHETLADDLSSDDDEVEVEEAGEHDQTTTKPKARAAAHLDADFQKLLRQSLHSVYEALIDLQENAALKQAKLEIQVTYYKKALADSKAYNSHLVHRNQSLNSLLQETIIKQQEKASEEETLPVKSPLQSRLQRETKTEKHILSLLQERKQLSDANYLLKKRVMYLQHITKECTTCQDRMERWNERIQTSSESRENSPIPPRVKTANDNGDSLEVDDTSHTNSTHHAANMTNNSTHSMSTAMALTDDSGRAQRSTSMGNSSYNNTETSSLNSSSSTIHCQKNTTQQQHELTLIAEEGKGGYVPASASSSALTPAKSHSYEPDEGTTSYGFGQSIVPAAPSSRPFPRTKPQLTTPSTIKTSMEEPVLEEDTGNSNEQTESLQVFTQLDNPNTTGSSNNNIRRPPTRSATTPDRPRSPLQPNTLPRRGILKSSSGHGTNISNDSSLLAQNSIDISDLQNSSRNMMHSSNSTNANNSSQPPTVADMSGSISCTSVMMLSNSNALSSRQDVTEDVLAKSNKTLSLSSSSRPALGTRDIQLQYNGQSLSEQDTDSSIQSEGSSVLEGSGVDTSKMTASLTNNSSLVFSYNSKTMPEDSSSSLTVNEQSVSSTQSRQQGSESGSNISGNRRGWTRKLLGRTGSAGPSEDDDRGALGSLVASNTKKNTTSKIWGSKSTKGNVKPTGRQGEI